MAIGNVRTVGPGDRAAWLRMRTALWPEDAEEHPEAIDAFLGGERRGGEVFVAEGAPGQLEAFLELGLRSYAEDCESSPVPYVEGWWVEPGARGRGVGARLMGAAEAWARERGFREIASDALLTNEASHAAHRALGFEETARIVCFRKTL